VGFFKLKIDFFIRSIYYNICMLFFYIIFIGKLFFLGTKGLLEIIQWTDINDKLFYLYYSSRVFTFCCSRWYGSRPSRQRLQFHLMYSCSRWLGYHDNIFHRERDPRDIEFNCTVFPCPTLVTETSVIFCTYLKRNKGMYITNKA